MERYIGAAAWVAGGGLLLFWAVRLWLLAVQRGKGQRPSPRRELLLALFTCCMAALLALALQPAPGWTMDKALAALRGGVASAGNINWVPFAMLREYFIQFHFGSFARNVLGNTLMLAPLGFFPPVLWKSWQKGWKVLLAGILCGFFIEFIQFFIGRTSDVDDVILNVVGTMAGYMAYRLLARLWPGQKRLAAGKATERVRKKRRNIVL